MPGEFGDMVKVAFEVGDADAGCEVETLWATPLGGDLYRLQNTPWFAYGVSYLDVVRARAVDDRLPVFEAVVEKSGNRTVRLILDRPAEPGNRSAEILDALAALGAGYEGANHKYLAVNIGPEVDFEHVCRLLSEKAAQWEHADPTYEELYPDSAG